MKNFLISAILLVFISTGLFAEQGGINGKIIDAKTMSPLPGANIIIMSSLLGASSDTTGFYYVGNIPEGLYQIKVSCIGFKTFCKPDIRVVNNKITRVPDIMLEEISIESGEVTVTAGLFQDNNDIPVSSFNFTKDEIKKSPGAAGDIFRALSSLPGVSTPGGEFSAFSVRGGGPKDNIIMIDNIPFSRISHFDEGGLEGENAQGGRFSIFTTSLIENAQFHAGGFPARYGGKNSSIIKLNIKEGNYNDVTVYGHYDLLGWEVNYDGPLPVSQKTGCIFSARKVNFKTILNLIDEKGHGIPAYSDLILKSTTEINSSNKISLLGIYSDDNYSRNVENVFESDNLNINQLASHNDYRYLAGFSWSHLFGRAGFINSTAYYYLNDIKLREGRVNTSPDFGIIKSIDNAFFRDNIYSNNRKEITFGSKSDLTIIAGDKLSFFMGVEGRQNKLDYNLNLNGKDTLYVFDKQDIRPDQSDYFIEISQADYDEINYFRNNYYAAYGEASLKIFPGLTINPGLRFEHYTYNNKEYYSPRISLRYQLTPSLSINASSGIYYQLPELQILAMDKLNKNLLNEMAVHFIAGISVYLSNDLKCTAETYYKKIDDVLVWTNRNDFKFTNSGTGKAYGLDLSLVKRFSDSYYGQLSYSYTISKRNNNDGTGEYDYEFSKPHMFNLLAGYQISDEWSVAAKWFITSGLPTDDYIVHSNIFNKPDYIRYSKEITQKNGHRFPVNHSLNIRIDYRKQFRYAALNLYIDVLNIYGAKNISREDFLSQTGSHADEALGIVPTFGFSLEF